jgi:hypothetical protein
MIFSSFDLVIRTTKSVTKVCQHLSNSAFCELGRTSRRCFVGLSARTTRTKVMADSHTQTLSIPRLDFARFRVAVVPHPTDRQTHTQTTAEHTNWSGRPEVPKSEPTGAELNAQPEVN